MDVNILLEMVSSFQRGVSDIVGFNILLMLPVFLFTEIISKLGKLKSKFKDRYTPLIALLAFIIAIPVSFTAFALVPYMQFISNALILSSVCSFAYIVVKPFVISLLNFARKKFKERTGVQVSE